MPRALISVYDKTNIVEFAKDLISLGWDLVASGGTEAMLRHAGLSVTPVEQVTGIPEMLGGRVKTLHPAIHAGILARSTPEDIDDLNRNGYAPIKLVVCNLYPFQETVSKAGVSLQDAIEQIDIGGVTLLRAAAKNFFHVACVSDPADYNRVIASLRATGDIDLAIRRDLAVKAFAHTSEYDTAIHAFLARGTMTVPVVSTDLPDQLSIGMKKIETLRYGENPHQVAAYYSNHASEAPLGGTILSGKQLSYNNILDLDAAWRAVSSFGDPTVVIVKHLTPCGIASADSIAMAYPLALQSDPVSAFGGVIAVNRTVDDDFITALGSLFLEAIAAPSFTESALNKLKEKRPNCRVLRIPQPYDGVELEIRNVHRGLLVQQADTGDPEGTLWKTVTQRPPTDEELLALQYAWKAVQHVKSNSIVLATKNATVGVGGGLPSRLDAVKIAVGKAGDRAKGAVLASDAFFPFADGLEVAIHAGITAVIQPGGSIRDNEVIEAADKAGIAMVMTGIRHFRH
ncbi:MAG: bifunctional phosphoribosylaminoimidazolecarboxamide formyltransferase/inosine monophosphate cyclohydrolase [Phototrophicales bacterium]|nr:MAG: bifunctional phosphoribosylaminoimidazolecarboxamide formyltransferase/inosine monophosphate cyclohydrolase [Phototrophicales bacterium]